MALQDLLVNGRLLLIIRKRRVVRDGRLEIIQPYVALIRQVPRCGCALASRKHQRETKSKSVGHQLVQVDGRAQVVIHPLGVVALAQTGIQRPKSICGSKHISVKRREIGHRNGCVRLRCPSTFVGKAGHTELVHPHFGIQRRYTPPRNQNAIFLDQIKRVCKTDANLGYTLKRRVAPDADDGAGHRILDEHAVVKGCVECRLA